MNIFFFILTKIAFYSFLGRNAKIMVFFNKTKKIKN
jgi:hypothetical protein